jgi:hypothetical protein
MTDLLHPPDVQLQVRALRLQRMQMTLDTPGEEAAQVRTGVLAGRTGQIGGDSSVELIGCLPGVSGNRGEFMLAHDPDVPPAWGRSQYRVTGSTRLVCQRPPEWPGKQD